MQDWSIKISSFNTFYRKPPLSDKSELSKGYRMCVCLEIKPSRSIKVDNSLAYVDCCSILLENLFIYIKTVQILKYCKSSSQHLISTLLPQGHVKDELQVLNNGEPREIFFLFSSTELCNWKYILWMVNFYHRKLNAVYLFLNACYLPMFWNFIKCYYFTF